MCLKYKCDYNSCESLVFLHLHICTFLCLYVFECFYAGLAWAVISISWTNFGKNINDLWVESKGNTTDFFAKYAILNWGAQGIQPRPFL